MMAHEPDDDDDGPEFDHNIRPMHVQVAERLIAQGLSYGRLLRHDELQTLFGMVPLADTKEHGTALQYTADELRYMAEIGALKRHLLNDHLLCLDSVFGQGYRVVPPAEQSQLAERRLKDDLRKAFDNADLRVNHIRLHELTATERVEAVNAQARIAKIRSMMQARRNGGEEDKA
jgi:hypothetical protein